MSVVKKNPEQTNKKPNKPTQPKPIKKQQQQKNPQIVQIN